MKYLDVPQSGSFAGNTHGHNRSGQYRRNRRSPVQPIGTGRRAFIRAAFGSASSAYAALTSAQQAAWQTYADAYPYVDSLGQSIKLTGHQMYVAINTQLLNCGQAQSDTPPASGTAWAVAEAGINSQPVLNYLLAYWDAGASADFLLIAFTPPQSSGRKFVERWWQAGVAAADDATFNAWSLFVAEFGVPGPAARIFCKLTPVSSQGVSGVPFVCSVFGGTLSTAAPVATSTVAATLSWTWTAPDPSSWIVGTTADGGLTWAEHDVSGGSTRTLAGLTAGQIARVAGMDADGNQSTGTSNSVTVHA